MQTVSKISLIGAVLSITAAVIHFNNDYMTFKERECLVIDKMTTTGGYKSSGRFYLVLKEDRGIIFDQIVSPATFSQAGISEKITFDLRQFDIKQTLRENVIYFFGEIILACVGVGLIAIGLIHKIWP